MKTKTKKQFPINHDLHTHTGLSLCSPDRNFKAEHTIAFAKENGYSMICFNDHFWDADVPGAMEWYQQQDMDHVKQLLPLPDGGSVKVLFGCETEYCGGAKIGISPAHYDDFEMIVVPVNHFHMVDFVRPPEYDTEEKIAELLILRLEEFCELNLPWTKIGIAHLNAYFGRAEQYIADMKIPESRLREVYRFLSKQGAGIEFNAGCFPLNWREAADERLHLFRIAAEENCKFYCASDAHTADGLGIISTRMRDIVDYLGLTEDNLFIPS